MTKKDNLIPFTSSTASEAGKKSSRKGIPNTATRLKRFLEVEQQMINPATGKTEKISVAERMDLAMIKKATSGDVAAYKTILERLEGQLSNTNGANVNISFNQYSQAQRDYYELS